MHQPGAVYVYNRSNSEWTQQAQLKASDGQIGDDFGSSLAANGNRILIGAPEQADGRGAAYLFEKGSDGTWSEVAQIALSDTSAEGELGASVALSGDIAFVGAPDENDWSGVCVRAGR